MSDGISDAYKNYAADMISNSQSAPAELKAAMKKTLTEGTKFDSGKPRVDLVPPSMILGVAEILTFGAAKYAAHNWRKGIAYSRIVSSLFRHLLAWVGGEKLDPESGKPHLWHVGCNVAFLIEFESNPEKYKQFDDLYKGE